MTPLPRPEPPTNRDIGRNRFIFGIVRRAAHVVCVHTAATRAARRDQIVRSCAVRSQCHAQGRSLTTKAWSPNTKPRRWRGAVSKFRAAMAADNLTLTDCLPQRQTDCNRKTQFFGQECFCPPQRLNRRRKTPMTESRSRTKAGLATMHAPADFATSQPARWTGVPAAMRAVAPGAVMTRIARPAPGKARACGETRPGDRAPGDRNAGEGRDAFAAAKLHQQPRGRCLTRTA